MERRNPYKFRLWFSNQNTDLFNDRQKRMVYHFLAWGPRGCDSWNYKLALVFHCSKRTIRRDLRHLEKHTLVDIRGALGKHRQIIAIPYPNRATWIRAAFKETARNVGDKFVHHQRRSTKSTINQQLDGLLYSTRLTTCGSVGEVGRFIEQTRHKIINELVHRGTNRNLAKNIANILCKKTLKKVQSTHGTTTESD